MFTKTRGSDSRRGTSREMRTAGWIQLPDGIRMTPEKQQGDVSRRVTGYTISKYSASTNNQKLQ